jgi:hypothetical protein
LADECGNVHGFALQSFAAKTAFLSLWFVVLGALVPLMLAAYVLVGPVFLPLDVPPTLVWLFFAVGLPLVLLSVVGVAASLRPGGFS